MNSEIETDIYSQLQKNAILFLKDGIGRLITNDNHSSDYITNELLTLTCTSFQISLELAIKALIVENDGIRAIADNKLKTLSDEEIKHIISEGNFKTQEFDNQKNFIKSKGYIPELTKEEFKIIDEFQIYRNRIVHFTYSFKEADLYDLKYDVIYYLIHIILKILLSKKRLDIRPSEYFETILGHKLYDSLKLYPPYIMAMESFAKSNSLKVFNCISCSNKSFNRDENYCYICNFYSDQFNLIDCDYCGESECVIYDNLNISLNSNEGRGECLNCKGVGTIYECPVCGCAHNTETRPNFICNCQ